MSRCLNLLILIRDFGYIDRVWLARHCGYGEYGDYDVLLDLSILEMIHSLLAWIKIVHSVDLARI